MSGVRALIRLLVTVACLPACARAGPGSSWPDSSLAPAPALTIRADVDSAIVVLDGKRAGVAPLTIDSLSEGTHVVRVLDPDLNNWLAGAVSDTLRLRRGDRTVRSYAVPRQISLLSTPPEADVFFNDSLIGATPLLLSRDSLVARSLLTVRKDGYQDAVIRPDQARRGFLLLPLVPAWSKNGIENALMEQSVVPGRTMTGAYLSGAAAVIAGVATAYLKIRADDRQSQYELTGNPALRSERIRLDRGAAVTLALTQISFGIFAYFLLSD